VVRGHFPKVLTAKQAASLATDVGYLDFTDRRLGGLITRVRSIFPDASIDAPAYARIEQRRQGHPWHFDTGTKGHMPWVRYTAGVLLVPADTFSGGGFYFRDAPDEPIFPYLDLNTWDGAPENEHCVASNSGERIVLLMFFGGGHE
jgi:hypothetical protein